MSLTPTSAAIARAGATCVARARPMAAEAWRPSARTRRRPRPGLDAATAIPAPDHEARL
jgi:hypothetical protein